ncbi:unnamed protein product [Cuscuta epithymum]|uniref:Uncharacterized protein n=1 Tax=Cuscuta epithymum TaxID=186058 RepID=A0AAV0D908_9ASTE|nr:unnamed protein product [Cuscuta epithymum]
MTDQAMEVTATASKGNISNEDHEATDSEAMGKIVRSEKELKQDDVAIKCETINGKTFELLVKPFRLVQASVIRVDSFLRLTDNLDKRGITFTAHCLESLPGVTKKKGEVCFGAKFTNPFHAFFGL